MDESEDSAIAENTQGISGHPFRGYPRLSGLWIIFLLFISFSLAFGFFLGLLTPYISLSWINLFGYAGSMGCLIWVVFVWKKKEEGSFRFAFSRPRGLDLLMVALMTLTSGIILDAFSGWMPPVPEWFERIYASMMQTDLPSFITVTFFAAFLEEMLCRGIILDGLLKNMSPAKAIFWSSFFFALMHLNPWQAIPGFLVGLLMGWLYWKSGSLWLPVWMHFLNNGLAYALTWYTGNDSASVKDLMSGGSAYLMVCIASVCIFLLSFKILSEKKLSSNETFRK